MKLLRIATVSAALLSHAFAFSVCSKRSHPTVMTSYHSSSTLLPSKSVGRNQDEKEKPPTEPPQQNHLLTLAHHFVVAATILASSTLLTATNAAFPLPAQAIELSSGAFLIETNANVGTSLVDARQLVTTLFKNRKAVAASFDRILQAVQTELQSPVFVEIGKELLQIEGDVLNVQVSPPSDITQTARDLSQGKLNFILNGEIINVAVDESFSKKTDELVVRINGVKGADISGVSEGGFLESIKGIYSRRWQERFAPIQNLWDRPILEQTVGDEVVQLTLGPTVAGSLVLIVVGGYAGSYAYYTNKLEEQVAAAQAKKEAMEAKKTTAKKKTKDSSSSRTESDDKPKVSAAPAMTSAVSSDLSSKTVSPKKKDLPSQSELSTNSDPLAKADTPQGTIKTDLRLSETGSTSSDTSIDSTEPKASTSKRSWLRQKIKSMFDQDERQ